MVGLDSNVVIRLLVGDDPHQEALAKKFIVRNCSPQEPAFINRVVVIECVWVLESVYHYSREHIAHAIDGLLLIAEFIVEDAPSLRQAVAAYRSGADFADAVIGLSNVVQGCRTTVTFDVRAAKQLANFSSFD